MVNIVEARRQGKSRRIALTNCGAHLRASGATPLFVSA
jgi:hypothetical protein